MKKIYSIVGSVTNNLIICGKTSKELSRETGIPLDRIYKIEDSVIEVTEIECAAIRSSLKCLFSYLFTRGEKKIKAQRAVKMKYSMGCSIGQGRK